MWKPILLAVAAFVTGCGSGAQPETWRFAIEEVEGSVQHTYAKRFAERVQEKSAGAVEVAIFPYGSLGTSAQLTEQVQNGTLDLAFASPGHLGSVIPEVQVFSLHFVLSGDEEVERRLLASRGEFRRLLDEAYRRHGLELLSLVSEGAMAWTANRPLREPADMRGLKMRTMVSPLLLASYEAYGANPSPLPYGEVYSALQLKMIDAQVNPVFAIEEMSFDEVQDYLMISKHAVFVSSVVASPRFVSGLADERRQILEEAIRELEPEAFEAQQKLNRERLDTIRKTSEIEIVELTDEQRAKFRLASASVRDRFFELAGDPGREILEALESEREQLAASL